VHLHDVADDRQPEAEAGGSLSIESRLGMGTRVTTRLPAAED